LRGHYVGITLSPANPDDLGLILADEIFTPDGANASCSSNDRIDATSSIGFMRMFRGVIQGNEDLSVPVAVTGEPSLPMRIGRESEDVSQGEWSIGGQINLLDIPVGIFFGQRSEEAEETGMGGMDGLGARQRASLVGDYGKAKGLTTISKLEEGFDHAESGQDSLLLGSKDTLIGTLQLWIAWGEPEDHLDGSQLL
jgi:hypothetical protein